MSAYLLTKPMEMRSDLPGFKVADARRALAGLPAPGDYRVLVKPLVDDALEAMRGCRSQPVLDLLPAA